MPKPNTPGLLVARMAEKHALSTGASRETPFDNTTRPCPQSGCNKKMNIQKLFGAHAQVSFKKTGFNVFSFFAFLNSSWIHLQNSAKKTPRFIKKKTRETNTWAFLALFCKCSEETVKQQKRTTHLKPIFQKTFFRVINYLFVC